MSSQTTNQPPASALPESPAERRVTVTDVDIPFGRLVVFFVKAGLAAVPAAIILMLVMMAIGVILGGFGHMLGLGPYRGHMWMY